MNTPPAAVPDTFEGWWTIAGDWVEPPNRRRDGWSGMLRVRIGEALFYVKLQCNHRCWSPRPPFRHPTAKREYDNLLRLRALAIGAPEPVFYGQRHSAEGLEAVLVTRELYAYRSLDTLPALDAEQRHAVAVAAGELIGRLHRARLQHRALYDKHLMLRWPISGAPEIALIDLESMRRQPSRGLAARRDLGQLARRQALWSPEDWQTLLQTHRNSLHGR